MWMTDPGELAAAPGTYILLLRLRAPAALPQRFGGTLPGGIYGYVGSARGPGGLRARCRRHLRREKSLRWHIDWLSAYAEQVMVAAFPDPEPGADECDFLDGFVASGATLPIRGFGSSDCRRCPSHLAAIEMPWSTAARARLVDEIQHTVRIRRLAEFAG